MFSQIVWIARFKGLGSSGRGFHGLSGLFGAESCNSCANAQRLFPGSGESARTRGARCPGKHPPRDCGTSVSPGISARANAQRRRYPGISHCANAQLLVPEELALARTRGACVTWEFASARTRSVCSPGNRSRRERAVLQDQGIDRPENAQVGAPRKNLAGRDEISGSGALWRVSKNVLDLSTFLGGNSPCLSFHLVLGRSFF